jgi:predicted transcriptional regulator of viral defense system
MASLKQTEIISKFSSSRLSLFTVLDIKKLFSIKKDNTAYKIIDRLTQKGIIKRLTKKKYLFTFKQVDDFQIANFLYSPSYISLESALCFYGMIAQFPYQITSITPKKTKIIEALSKDFTYFHIKEKLFFGYEKKESFLIALPEKALVDYLYFCSKGLRNFEGDEFELKIINKERFKNFLLFIKEQKLNKFIKGLNLC